MPFIKPFRALRYYEKKAGKLEDLIAPPFDIIYEEWRDKLYERNENNVIRLIKNREDLLDENDYGSSRNALKNLNEWKASGILKNDNEPAIYVLSDTFDVDGREYTRYGFVALVRLTDFGKGIYPHERTLSKHIDDRLNLLKNTRTNFCQVFSVFRDPEHEISEIIENVTKKEPDAILTDELKIERKLWILQDMLKIEKICNLMKDRDVIIADGHHRYTAALRCKEIMGQTRKNNDEPFDYVQMYFSDSDSPGMIVQPTHRKIGGITDFNIEKLFSALSDEFELEKLPENDLNYMLKEISVNMDCENIFGIYSEKGYFLAKYKKPEVPKELDVKILHDIVIEKILGISQKDISEGKYVRFSRSAEHAVKDVEEGREQAAFILNTIPTDGLFRTVLRGELMPQKSTYFYPKTLSGLVMYNWDDN